LADALRLEGRSKKRLLVDRLETACRRAEMHLPHGKYIMQKHDTERHCTVRHASVQTTSNYLQHNASDDADTNLPSEHVRTSCTKDKSDDIIFLDIEYLVK
jgi:hypothetical protein